MTELDVEIAAMLYPVLVDLAREEEKGVISFNNLIHRARTRFPDNMAMQRQVPVGIGRRLKTVRLFTDSLGYPDLTCLVVRPGNSIPPDVFKNPEAMQAQVAAFDWSNVETEFSLQIATWRQAAQNRPKRKLEEAKSLMAEYYIMHRASLPPAIREYREQIITELMTGEEVEGVFAAIVKDLPGSGKAAA